MIDLAVTNQRLSISSQRCTDFLTV